MAWASTNECHDVEYEGYLYRIMSEFPCAHNATYTHWGRCSMSEYHKKSRYLSLTAGFSSTLRPF